MLFFFNDTATTEIYTLSLHDALPILRAEDWDARYAEQQQWSEGPNALVAGLLAGLPPGRAVDLAAGEGRHADRKSTRLNSSHANLVCRLLLENKSTKYLVCHLVLEQT